MKTTGPREQDWSCDEVIKTPGLKRLEHLNLNLNTVNWWMLTGRDDVTKRRSSGASDFTEGRGEGFKFILAINTLSIFGEIPIRWIQHLTGH